MADKPVLTASASSSHAITLIDVHTGAYMGSIYVTSGSIIGQPLVSADMIVVTYQEGGVTYINKYSTDTKAFMGRQRIS